ncbi:hypothetical protein SLA2020_437530 [Shorea laevis]
MHDIPIGLWKAELERLREIAKLPNDRIQTALGIRKGGGKVKFSFSDSPDVSLALECGANVVYQRNMEDLKCTMVQLITSYVDTMYLNRNSCKEATVDRSSNITMDARKQKLECGFNDEVGGTGSSYEEDPRPQRVPIQAIPPEDTSVGTPKRLIPNGPAGKNYDYPTPPQSSLSLSLLSLDAVFCYVTGL